VGAETRGTAARTRTTPTSTCSPSSLRDSTPRTTHSTSTLLGSVQARRRGGWPEEHQLVAGRGARRRFGELRGATEQGAGGWRQPAGRRL